MKLPRIKKGEILLLRAEKKTGIVLNNDNSYYKQIGNNFYEVFVNIYEAKKYIENNPNNEIEYNLYDYQHKWIERC